MADHSLARATAEVQRLADEAANRRLDATFARVRVRERVRRLVRRPRVLAGAFITGFLFGGASATRVGRNVARLPGGLVSLALLASRLRAAFQRQSRTEQQPSQRGV